MHQVKRVLSALCRKVGTPLAKQVLDLALRDEWAELQKLRVLPDRYATADEYFADAICVSLLRKCQLPGDSQRRYDAAVATFWACELRNKRTNDHLERFISGEGLSLRDGPVLTFIELWRKEIYDVLGPLPKDLVPRFSGGSTYADVGPLKTIPDKMTNRATYYTIPRTYSNSFGNLGGVVRTFTMHLWRCLGTYSSPSSKTQRRIVDAARKRLLTSGFSSMWVRL